MIEDAERKAAREAMQRLKRRVGKERARCIRIWKSAHESAFLSAERAAGEANYLGLVMRWIDDEIKKTLDEKGAAPEEKR